MKLKLAVVYGGRSGEHEISLRSAKSILAALNRERYEVTEFLIAKDGNWSPGPILPAPGANPGIDVVFPVLHGTFGEDGTMQGLLELADLPYVGPGVLASSLNMDKELMKQVCRAHGIPVAEWITQYRGKLDADEVLRKFTLPVFVKPANLGSSVGISKVKRAGDVLGALEEAAKYDHKVIIERNIEGLELECAVLGNEEPKASLPCRVIPSREFYDYEDKYLLDEAKFELPAKLDATLMAEVRRLAEEAFRVTGCEGMARVDFLVESSTGTICVNEINTIPGFTSISMYPKMWEATGVPYAELLDRLIDLAMARQARKRATRFER